MTEDQLDDPCGKYLTFRDLIQVGEAQNRLQISNLPQQPETVRSLRNLAVEIIDPVVERFGALEITYGFAGPSLTRHISARIDPTRDQHAGHELKPNGRPICPRLGQAVDFRIKGICSRQVAAWISEHLSFDRLYFYGADRPLHVSSGPENARAIVTMFLGKSGRRIPQVRTAEWLSSTLPI